MMQCLKKNKRLQIQNNQNLDFHSLNLSYIDETATDLTPSQIYGMQVDELSPIRITCGNVVNVISWNFVHLQKNNKKKKHVADKELIIFNDSRLANLIDRLSFVLWLISLR